jgi:phosphoserine phosphatase
MDGVPIGPAHAVVLIYSSATARDENSWHALTLKLVTAISGSVTATPSFLCSADRTQHPRKFTVLEILAETTTAENNGHLSLARCHELRTSTAVQAVEEAENVEIIIQPVDLYYAHKTPGLAVFDMDSTLIQQEVIDELARSVGRYEQVAAVTEAAMRGELDFEASLRARVKELKVVSTDIWETLKKDVITFTPGARELVQFLRSRGWKTAVLSGGFTPLAYWVKDTLGLDYAYANQLAVDASTSTLSGELLSDTPIVGAAKKRELLLQLAADNDIPLAQTIAVGDGSNDLLMMNAAGLGIAFNAKPKVQQAAPARLNGDSLLDVAYILGYKEDEIVDALEGAN